jgi:ribosomal protein L22
MTPLIVKDLELNINQDRRVIYRKTHKFGRKEFVIEISKTKMKYFILAVRANKKQKQQVIQVIYKLCNSAIATFKASKETY